MGTGADVAVESAGITLLRGDAANIRNNVQPLETAVARSEQKGKES